MKKRQGLTLPPASGPLYNTNMKIVLHGANVPALHEHEQALLAQIPSATARIWFNAQKQTLEELAETLGAQSMFQSHRLWHITQWEKNRSPKQRLAIVSLLADAPDDVLVTIPSDLTAAQKKVFDPKVWQLKEFKLPKVLFQFTEAIKTKSLKQTLSLLQQALDQKNEWELHSLLARQFRLLLAAKTGAPVLAPPFAQKSLRTQAQLFTESQLIQVLHTLFAIEFAMKSGQAHLSWSQEIDRLLVRLYDEET